MQDTQEQRLLDGTEYERLGQQGFNPALSKSQQALVEDPSLRQGPCDTASLSLCELDSRYSKTSPKTRPQCNVFTGQQDPIPEAESKRSSFRLPGRTKSEELWRPLANKKPKRPMWKSFGRHTSKQEQAKIQPSLTENAESNNVSPSASMLGGPGQRYSEMQEAPTEVETSAEPESYFELQQAMSGIQLPGDTTDSSVFDYHGKDNFSSPESSIATVNIDESSTTTLSDDKYTINNPYRQLRLEAQSRQSYIDQRSCSVENVSRFPPVQRVREGQQRSRSRDITPISPPPGSEPLSGPQAGEVRLGSINSGLVSDMQQIWQTTTLNNNTLSFEVKFEDQSFTNKISAPAAEHSVSMIQSKNPPES